MAPFSKLLLVGCSLLIGLATFAEPQRTTYTVENRFPTWGQLEVGADYGYREVSDDRSGTDIDASTLAAEVRYGLAEQLTVIAEIPYTTIDPTFDDKERGIGDLSLGLQLFAYENAFGYPYIIPHLFVDLPTGDEDKLLGAGEVVVTPGISFGTVVDDVWNWVLDVRYRIQGDAENQFQVGASLLYEVSDEFGLLAESRYEDSGGTYSEDSSILVIGGLAYDVGEQWLVVFNAGTAVDGNVDVITNLRATFSF